MSPQDAALLGRLAAMPFLDRLELAALAGRSRSAAFRRVAALEAAGLLESFVHSSELIAATRRYALSAQGVGRLAEQQGLSPAQQLRREPVSREERRLVLERLDTAALLYRLAAALAEAVRPIKFRWYRARPVDAAIGLPDGRRIGLVRWGRSAERTAFAKRMRRLRRSRGLGAVLLTCPDEVRLRYARRLVSGAPAIAFLALEGEAAVSGSDARIWRAPSGASRLSLRETLGYAAAHQGWTDEPALARVTMPQALEGRAEIPSWMLPAALTAAEKRALDLIADWAWIRPAQLRRLLGVGERRLGQLLRRPRALELVEDPLIAGRRRLVLSERGLALIARRDRSAVGAARQRWSPECAGVADLGAPSGWRRVKGRRAGQLLRHLEHTEAVHWYCALLAEQARAASLELVQLDPPHRAARYFRHRGRRRAVRPDAFGVLRSAREDWPFFLEWERRAVRPATMRARLAPYLRYYDSARPEEDHGRRPAVFVVFQDPLAADHFRRVAAEEMQRAQVVVPLLVSHRDTLEQLGALGSGWRSVAG